MGTKLSSKVIGIDTYRTTTEEDKDALDITSLALQLQQTLELSPLLQTFCQETARIVPCDSVSYNHDQAMLNYLTGEKSPHKCSYQLELENHQLGTIECSRKTPFSLKEMALMERLLSILIYPLRNALLYQKAVAEAHRDPLTGIGNRAAFDEALERETCTHKRHLTHFSLLIIDVDHFKTVNDSFGHITGDTVLCGVTERICKTIRRSDEVFRFGGEEFVVILPNTDAEGARFIAERIRKEIKSQPFNNNKKT